MPNRRYMVVPVGPPAEGLGAKIDALTDAEVYEDEAPRFWLVAYGGTTQGLSDAIGLGDDEIAGTAIIVPVPNYAGYAPADIWEWLDLHGNGN